MGVKHDPTACHLCRPRTVSDTCAGILYEPHPVRSKFFVHCSSCGRQFGPCFTLAEAQRAGRVCQSCWWAKLAQHNAADGPSR